MNERIKELSSQVGAVYNVLAMGRSDGVLFTECELEKFAELIVNECVTVLNNRFMGDMNREDLEVRRCIADVKKHFGENDE